MMGVVPQKQPKYLTCIFTLPSAQPATLNNYALSSKVGLDCTEVRREKED